MEAEEHSCVSSPTVPEAFWAQAAEREMLMLQKGFVEMQNVSETLLGQEERKGG